MVRRSGSAPPASAMSVRRSAIDLPARWNGSPGWICTINLLGQSQALCSLSYGAEEIRLSVLPRSGLAYKASASAALPSRNKMAEAGGNAPHPTKWNDPLSRRSRRAGPVQLPNENGGSPRCCPVLCGLRIRCIAAMLATRAEASGHAPQPAHVRVQPVSSRRRFACPL